MLCIGESGHRWSPFSRGDLGAVTTICRDFVRCERRCVPARSGLRVAASALVDTVLRNRQPVRLSEGSRGADPHRQAGLRGLDLSDEWEVVGMIADLNGATHPVVMTWIVERGGPPRLTSTRVDVP